MRLLVDQKYSRWALPGTLGHEPVVAVVRGPGGELRVDLDDHMLFVFTGPRAATPWVESKPFEVGPKSAVVAARALRGGSVECDVFLDGQSLDDGATLEETRNAAPPRSAGRAILMDPTAGPSTQIRIIRFMPIVGVAAVLLLLAGNLNAEGLPQLGVGIGLYLLASLVTMFIAMRGLEMLATPPRHLADGTATLVMLLCLETNVLLIILLLASPLVPRSS